MARVSPNSLLFFIVVSCIGLLIQTGDAGRHNEAPASAPNSRAVAQELDVQGCIQSFTGAAVCFTDLWTHLGKPPSEACCNALVSIEQDCWLALFPQFGPSFAPFLKAFCSAGGSGLPFPFPFPFPTFPFPLPFLNPPPVGGSGGGGFGGGAPPPNKA